MKRLVLMFLLCVVLSSCADTSTIKVCELKKEPFTISYQLHGYNDKIETVYRTVVIDTRIFSDEDSLDSYITSLDNIAISGSDLYAYKAYTLTSSTYYDVIKTLDYLVALGYECY